MKFPKLFEPARIGSMRLRNRIVMAPVSTNFATEEGYVTERLREYYEERARGGAGLIIVEATCVDSAVGKSAKCRLVIDDDRYIPGMIELAQAVNQHGAKIAIQLYHAGRQAKSSITFNQPVAPSEIRSPRASSTGAQSELPKELTVGEIKETVARFAKAAARAKRAGVDAVEIHAGHYYLINQFLSSASNRRHDDYGGDLKNRARFLLEVIRATRDSVGQSYPILCRINGEEYGIKNGLTLVEAKEVARLIQEAGADCIHVSAMAYGADFLRAPLTPVPNGFLHLAEEVKKAVCIPVIAVGRIDPELGERALLEGKADFIAMGRALIADPGFPNKLASGNLEEVRPCIRCYVCTDRRWIFDKDVACTVNAAMGKEREYRLRVAGGKKKILVVGGGPAGMEAARVAAQRGHEVMLYEKSQKLGGQLLLATLPPHKEAIRGLIDYLEMQVKKAGVEVVLKKETTPALVEEIKPDVVVLATGIIPLIPEIPGITRASVATAGEVLEGKVEVSEKVIIIGGGMIGCETAEFLVSRGRKVTILEMLEELAARMTPTLRISLLNRLGDEGVILLTGVKCEEITGQGVLITMKENRRKLIEGGTILVATGGRPNTGLFNELQGRPYRIHLAGDSVAPRTIADAISDGYSIGRLV